MLEETLCMENGVKKGLFLGKGQVEAPGQRMPADLLALFLSLQLLAAVSSHSEQRRRRLKDNGYFKSHYD